MSNLKISIIGVGHLGKIHAKLWKENENTKLEGIYDSNSENAIEVSENFKVKNFNSIDEAIDASDAIVIATPTTTHYEIAKNAIEKGKHCFIEKPITQTYEEAKKLCELSEKYKVKIQVGHVERFNPALSVLKKTEVEPLFIEAHRLAQFKVRATDVSVVHDLMIHDIDLVLSFIDSKVKSIDANGVSVLTEKVDICNARISFENGAVANLTASRISPRPMRKMRFFQKDSYLSIDFAKPDLEIFRILDEGVNPQDYQIPATMLGSIDTGIKNRNIYYEKPELPTLNAIGEEQKAFAKSIWDNTRTAITAEEASEALRIAEEISRIIS